MSATARIQLRRDTSTNLSDITPSQGEPVYSTDTKVLKIGDDYNEWSVLNSIVTSNSTTGITVPAVTTEKLVVSGTTSTGIDVSGITSTGLKVSGEASTEGILISGITPTGINITGANTTGIDVSGTTSTGIDVSGITSTGLKVSGEASTSGIEVSGATPTGIEVSGATTTGIDVSGATTTGLKVSGEASTSGILVSGATTTGIDVSGNASSTGLLVSGTAPTGIDVSGATTTGIDVSGNASTQGILVSGATPTGIDVSGATTTGINLTGPKTNGVVIGGATGAGLTISDASSGIVVYTIPYTTSIYDVSNAGIVIYGNSNAGMYISGNHRNCIYTNESPICAVAIGGTPVTGINVDTPTDTGLRIGGTPTYGINVDNAINKYCVNGTQVVGAQQPAIANATTSSDVITQFNLLLNSLRIHGLIQPIVIESTGALATITNPSSPASGRLLAGAQGGSVDGGPALGSENYIKSFKVYSTLTSTIQVPSITNSDSYHIELRSDILYNVYINFTASYYNIVMQGDSHTVNNIPWSGNDIFTMNISGGNTVTVNQTGSHNYQYGPFSTILYTGDVGSYRIFISGVPNTTLASSYDFTNITFTGT